MRRGVIGGLLAVACALATAGAAAADPPPPGPPPVVGAPDLAALQNQMLLGQTAEPALPGTDPATLPTPNALNNAYLLPQNVEPSAPGQGQIVGVAPGDENADVKKIDYLRRLWATYQQGGLHGGLLGQAPR